MYSAESYKKNISKPYPNPMKYLSYRAKLTLMKYKGRGSIRK